MPAFTFTAPRVSPQETEAERAALSEEERQLLEEEVYGRDSTIEETPELLQNALQLFDEAMEFMSPSANKTAYLEALEKAPDLVELETPVVAFLRCEKFDAWAAALRMLSYWTLRIKLFGPERAFLPMTKNGALRDDQEHIPKALACLLEEDEKGRTVVFLDRVRATAQVAPRDSVLRIVFYTMHTASLREDTQRRGFVCIVNLQGYDLYHHYDRLLSKRTVSIVTSCPVKMRAMHIMADSGKVLSELVLPVLLQMLGKELRMRAYIHKGHSTLITDRFQAFGLSKNHVMASFQGARAFAKQENPEPSD